MATTPTNKPIPSEDPRDLKFNAGKIDEEVNGSADYYTDRFSVQRLTNTGRNNQFQDAQTQRGNDFTDQMNQQADDWLNQFNQQNEDFQQFLLNSGYQFLGDYENGPFQFSARNQYIRYNNQYYRLNAATNVGFTTTGTDAASFASDVTHFVLMDGDTLRQNLGSDEEGSSGGTLVELEEKISVQAALSPMLYSGRVVRLSVYYARGLSDDAAFAAAFADSKNADGYNCRIIVNDTPHTVEITDTIYEFRTNLETRYNLNTYSGFNCGVIGEFKFNGTARFKFIRCYRPYVSVVIEGGTGIAGIDTTTPTNSSVAVQLDTVVVAPEIHIDVVNYPGYGLATFGTKFLASQGVKGMYPSTVNAYLSGGAVYMAGTNGFGEFSSIWELDCTHGSVFNSIYDVVVHKFEGADLLTNNCNSLRFGHLLLGVANAKIFDSQGVYIGHHLGVARASPLVAQTQDLYCMDIVNSYVRFGQSRLFGSNCGFRIGSAAFVLFEHIEGRYINQAISITNNNSYTGTSSSVTADVHIKSINVVDGNGQYAYSSKHCIHVDDGMLANLTVEDGRIQWNVNGRTSEYAYAIYGGSLSTSHIKIDNVRLLGNYDAEPVYMPNYDCIVKMHTPDTEVNVGGTRTTGSGRRLRINWGMSTTETEYTSKPTKRVYVVATVNAAGGNFIARVDGKPAMYAAGVAGTFSGTFEVSKGQKAYYSMASSSVVDSYAELELG